VPGPQFPLYMRGHKLLSWYPYVPVGGEMALNCAILSYNGVMYFGFSGDVHAAPDLRRLEDLLKESFRELKEATLEGPPSKKKKSGRRPQARAAAAPKRRRAPLAESAVAAVATTKPGEVEKKTASTTSTEDASAQMIA